MQTKLIKNRISAEIIIFSFITLNSSLQIKCIDFRLPNSAWFQKIMSLNFISIRINLILSNIPCILYYLYLGITLTLFPVSYIIYIQECYSPLYPILSVSRYIIISCILYYLYVGTLLSPSTLYYLYLGKLLSPLFYIICIQVYHYSLYPIISVSRYIIISRILYYL